MEIFKRLSFVLQQCRTKGHSDGSQIFRNFLAFRWRKSGFEFGRLSAGVFRGDSQPILINYQRVAGDRGNCSTCLFSARNSLINY